jgi:hypothetical protein
MQKPAKLEFVALGVGLKAPLKVLSDDKLLSPGPAYDATSIPPSDVSMTNHFMDIDDFESFKKFAEKYGLEMFHSQLERSITKRQMSAEDMLLRVVTFDRSQIHESKLKDIWHRLDRYIRKTQREVHLLMENKVSDLPAYRRQLERGLSATRVRVSKHEKRNDYALFLSGRGIKEACFLQVALAGNEVSVCDRSSCPNTFFKVRGKKYCSDSCKETARKERRLNDPLEKPRRALKERAARRRIARLLTPDDEQECRREINAARTKTKLRDIEKRYGLQKQPAGRKRAQEKLPRLEGRA